MYTISGRIAGSIICRQPILTGYHQLGDGPGATAPRTMSAVSWALGDAGKGRLFGWRTIRLAYQIEITWEHQTKTITDVYVGFLFTECQHPF
jgi:hypothetical protein